MPGPVGTVLIAEVACMTGLQLDVSLVMTVKIKTFHLVPSSVILIDQQDLVEWVNVLNNAIKITITKAVSLEASF